MKIRVLHMIDHLGYGGAPLVVKGLVESMPPDRVESLVCALRPNPHPIDLSVPVHTLDCHRYSWATIRAVVRLSAAHKVHIVHAHLQKALISCLLAAPRCDSALILHEHGPVFRRGTGCFYRLALKLWGDRANTIVANSRAAAEAVSRILGLRDVPVVVVPNAVDLERFDPALYDRNAIRARLNLGYDDFVVGFVGRLDKAKGVDLLVEAGASLRDQGEACRFYIVGEGTERAHLEKRVCELGLSESVTLAGLSENPAEIMPAFDVAVVPSRREAFGISALELMRMKIPVIVSPVGGLPELVEDGRTGIILPECTPAAIAAAIVSLRDDLSMYQRMAQVASDRATAFGQNEVTKQLLGVYERILSRTTGTRTL